MKRNTRSLTFWRHSKTFRIISLFLLLDFLTSQNLYGQEYALQEGTHLYTPVLEVDGEPLPSEREGIIKDSLKVFVAGTPQFVASALQNQILFEIPVEKRNQKL